MSDFEVVIRHENLPDMSEDEFRAMVESATAVANAKNPIVQGRVISVRKLEVASKEPLTLSPPPRKAKAKRK